MSRYSLFKRFNSNFYYAQLKNPKTGTYLPAKSTGQTDKSEALLVVADWLKNGIPDRKEGSRTLRKTFSLDTVLQGIRETDLNKKDAERIVKALKSRGLIESAILTGSGKETERLIPFLQRFWNYDESGYVREKLAYGHSIGRRHCYEQDKHLNHWKNYFGDKAQLCSVTREQLKKFQLYLRDKQLAPKTVNKVISAGSVAFGWLFDQGILDSNPAAGLRKFSGKSKERGILNPQQVQKLFTIPWPDNRARTGNLLAMTTGLRSGEVVALRFEDIGKDRLYIRHSWSFADKLKKPKNGEEREVPLLPIVREELLKLDKENPHGSGGFLFYHHSFADQPCDGEILRKGLQQALLDITLSKADQKDTEKLTKTRKAWMDEGICFHSWRHFYATHLANKIEMRKVQLVTGHQTGVMAEHYANHAEEEDFKDVAAAVRGAFGNIIPFGKTG